MSLRRPKMAWLALAIGLFAGAGLAQQVPQRQMKPDHEAAAGEDRRALTLAGPLQGNWRVLRAGDRAAAAILRVQIIHDGSLLEGSYIYFQPFCSLEQPLPVAGTDECEFIDLGGQITSGQSTRRWATVILRPGADGLDHRIRFRNRPTAGPLTGRYYTPGDRTGVPVVLERAPE